MLEGRYNRHNLIDWFSQETLRKTKVAIIGAGAVGNEVIKNLALLGVGELRVFDLDVIEEHNLTRSVLFREEHVGQPKAEVAAREAIALDKNVNATGTHGDFWNHLRLAELKTFDLLFCCVDNFEARIRCNTLCFLAHVDFINIAIDSRSAVVECYPFSRELETCYECSLPGSVYRRISERYSCGHLRKVSFLEKNIPTTIITSSCAAALGVSLGLRLGNADMDQKARRIYVDTIGGTLTQTTLSKNESCPCCSRLPRDPRLYMSRRLVVSIGESNTDLTVTTSEPILAAYRVQNETNIVFENAAKFDSNFPATVSADPGLVELEIRDQFTLKELASRFAGRDIPCKFAIVSDAHSTTVFEFQETLHE